MRSKELLWSLAAGALLGLAWLLSQGKEIPGSIALALYIGSYIFGGLDLIKHTVGSLRKGHLHLDIDLLMLVAAIGAACLGQLAEGAFLLFLFSLAHALEHGALDRAKGAIRSLADLAPAVALVVRNGVDLEIPVDQVVVGDVALIRAGDRIPVDGYVIKGQSSVNQSPITGESIPIEKGPGSGVFAGTINGDGTLSVYTSKVVGDRTLDRVIKLVTEARKQKAPTQQFTERFERVFVPILFALDLIVAVVPALLGVWSWQTGIYRALGLLVAASPCALALGTPATVLAAIAQAARKGVLIKGGVHLENLGTVRAIAFDKTGTLTLGRPEVTDLIPFEEYEARELLLVAASVERGSQHPLAHAILKRWWTNPVLFLQLTEEVQSIPGRGLRAMIEGKEVELGGLSFWETNIIPQPVRSRVEQLISQGRSVVLVRYDKHWMGVIGIADRPRKDVKQILESLRRKQIQKLIMLTGDNQVVAEIVGKEVGIDEIKAGLMPEDKLEAIREIRQRFGAVAMVGDGVNDAPALAHATVGIAMGGAGTAVALETADVALMGDDLQKLPFAVGLSRAARRVIQQNLFVSLGVIVVLMFTTVLGISGIGLTVVVHEGSTLLVLVNALRLLGFQDRPETPLGV